jgi:amidophosphoribosyltransferase
MHDAAVMPVWAGAYYNAGVPIKLREHCGVFGVWNVSSASSLCYYGLHALQHRGQESAGICVNDDSGMDKPGRFAYYRGMGLVKEVFDEPRLASLMGTHAIAHVRYATSGESQLTNAQPLVFAYRGGDLAIATNGNIVNAPQLRAQLEAEGSIFQTTSDTEVVAHLIARSRAPTLVMAIAQSLRQLEGAFAFLFLTNTQLIAAQDGYGLRPFVLGAMQDGYVLASETCAFDAIGAQTIRDIAPGEMLVFDAQGMRSETFLDEPHRRALCAMEYIYFARPDSDMDGVNIHTARKRMGKRLAIEAFVDADLVTGVPDSSISAAIGFAEQTGIPYELGLIKNRYAGRTFIQPSQQLREQGVKMKLSAVRKVVEGKRVIMIDDSIVRGTTSLRIVKLLREAGATQVHVRITSPPFANPCFYGINTPTREELIASHMSIEDMRRVIEADSLAFLSKEGMLSSIGRRETSYNMGMCTACFDHDYPSPIPKGES